MAFIADFVMEIIFALEIGGFESIRENSCNANAIRVNAYIHLSEHDVSICEH